MSNDNFQPEHNVVGNSPLNPHYNPQPRLSDPFPPQPPKKKSTARTVAICLFAGLGGIAVLASVFGAGGGAPETSKPAVVTTVDNGPTPDPVTTPTDKPSAVKPTQAPKPTKTAPKLTASQEQAIGAAESYLSFQAFSRKGLIHPLSSDAGEGFPVADATFAVDYLKVNWNEQAARSAKSYLAFQYFSRKGLIHQLESSAGEGFTHAQAVYGVNKAGL